MEQQKQITQLLDGRVSAKEIADFIDNLPQKIRAMLPTDEHDLLDSIECGPLYKEGTEEKAREFDTDR